MLNVPQVVFKKLRMFNGFHVCREVWLSQKIIFISKNDEKTLQAPNKNTDKFCPVYV